jgi:membrane-associated phospholipid phosphatase
MAHPPHLGHTKRNLDGYGSDTHTHTPEQYARRWLVLSAAVAVWHRFRSDSSAIGPAAWRAWRRMLAIGCVITLLLTAGLVEVGQWLQGRGLQAWDIGTLRWVAAAGPLSFASAITWQAPGDLLFQPIFVIAFVALAMWFSRPLIAASMAASYVLTFIFIWGGWGLWNRARPNLIAGGIAAPGLHSFPSGHAVLVVAIYGLVAYVWARASRSWLERILAVGLCIIWSALVGVARLALGAHWPSDVLGGYIIGLVWLVAVIAALRHAERLARAPAADATLASS